MERGADTLACMGIGDYAAADQSGGGEAILRPVYGGVAGHPLAGGGRGGATVKALGGAGLL